ncbi:PREDICTED: cell adhesion molecule 2-like [Priapulus caudatus]|uniref:Cell adhesion molecule 2-like n=1 Tax=Priapulus caudatus TaxID=37621 RepID=A0ABM1F3V7_PRICU|nr:PREDICTED: cell adhesion molecule 2-like [Priapulus caudatus]
MSFIDSSSSPDGMLQFSCVSDSSNPAASVTWLLNGEDITADSSQTEEAGSRTNTFTANSILSHTFSPIDNDRELQCNVLIHGDLAVVELAETLYLKDTVTISSSSNPTGNEVFLPETEKLTLTCNADGYPEPSYTWFHDKQGIQAAGDEVVIELVEFKHRRLYACKATSVFGEYMSSNKLNVTVVVPATYVPIEIDGNAVADTEIIHVGPHEASCTSDKSFRGNSNMETW